MTYDEVISNNCKYNSPVSWWPKYAFHYTDVTNAIGILKTGYLYSRYNAEKSHLMSNDNASRQVIDMTYSGAESTVRFYFRPLTPTQYHNEGFKHPSLRYCHDLNANVPVPVFFLFDLNSLLQLPDTQFSEQSLAGGGVSLLSGEENFASLNFTQIYKTGYMKDTEQEKKYRHAEIVYPGAFDISDSLKYIICRNQVERSTLLNLLRKEGSKTFSRYKDKVFVMADCFENNGLYIKECAYYTDKAVIVCSKTASKIQYTSRYKEDPETALIVHAYAEFDWYRSTTLLERRSCNFHVDYESSENITFTNLAKPQGATALYMQVYFEGKLMCYMCWQLSDSALL